MFTKLTTRHLALTALIVSVLLLFSTAALAQSPAAGTSIGNQASATYTDGSSIQRTATSNSVVTTVAQVAAFTLTSDNAKTATPGAQVVYTHTLTNTGNGNDSFTITTGSTGGDFTFSPVAVYLDANNDGIPDNGTNLAGSSVALSAGSSVHLLVIGTVPVSATSGQKGYMTITTKSVFDGTVASVTNTDTTTVTNNAVVNVTKSLSATSGASPSGPYTVTLTYTNNGNATATGVTLADALPTGMTYVAGSARWSVTGSSVALTDATGDKQGSSPQIDYSVSGSTITAVIDSVPATVSGTLTFQVNIASGLAPGAINNTATVTYNDGTKSVGPVPTNTATFTVLQSASLTMKDTGSSATGDSDNSQNGTQLVASANQGATVTFNNIVTNTGNGTDTFNITLSGSTFPTGTTFALYKSDGVSPLTDSNSDGIPDSGPIAAGANYTVVVKATLPPSASGNNNNNGWVVIANATSTVAGAINAGATASVTEKLTTITASAVDITNGTGKGTGAGPESSAVTTISVNPGSTATFPLFVNNTAGPADSYDLLASQDKQFASITLPSGWTIAYQVSNNGTDCSSLGSTVTNTGVINASSNKLYCAAVTVPAGYAAGTQPIYFRALSSTTNAVDIIYDAVSVNIVHAVTFTPNNSGQIFPGGSVVYNHTIKNNGNVAETVTFSGSFVSDNQSNWASILYQDNGTTANSLDSGDQAVTTSTTIPLAPGASVVVLTKVTAPPAAATGAVDTTTLTATYNGGNNTATATDTSTVIAGQLRLDKMQAANVSCNGTPDSPGFVKTNLSAKPATCLIYQITATNEGTAAVTTVVVSDATPANTTYTTMSGHPASATLGTVTAPADGSAGTVSVSIPTLNPGASAVITFGVKINQ